WAEAAAIYRYPINAAVCVPKAGARVMPGTIDVAGYALASGEPGTSIERVEVSADGGRTWTDAKLHGPQQAFCWRLWNAQLAVDRATSRLTVRATDSRGHVQPREAPWNLKGYLYNAWHHVPVEVSG
ncbi:MAG: molybdopterin oxidoreductase, partial [Planctomycetes bacterium]|nr:molybdopterin oxidoreductase [Planctomycetota bacterium]